ncbi:MAG: hypothetical protein HQK53_11380 [Oligoflexia bacterium]|nr:hypothetical protein [Oligoflexia bacterium]
MMIFFPKHTLLTHVSIIAITLLSSTATDITNLFAADDEQPGMEKQNDRPSLVLNGRHSQETLSLLLQVMRSRVLEAEIIKTKERERLAIVKSEITQIREKIQNHSVYTDVEIIEFIMHMQQLQRQRQD